MKMGDRVVYVNRELPSALGVEGLVHAVEDGEHPTIGVTFDSLVSLQHKGPPQLKWGCAPSELLVLSVYEQLARVKAD